MRFRDRSACLIFIALLQALLPAPAASQETSWQKENAIWREQHKVDLLKPDGWLSLAGLEWLQPGDNSVGSAPDNKIHLASGPANLALLHLEGETVTLNPPTGGFPPDFLVAGAPAKPQSLRAEANNDKVSPHLTIGTLNMYVIRRETRFALRIKDSHSAAIAGFRELKWYPPRLRLPCDRQMDSLFPAQNNHTCDSRRHQLRSARSGRRGICSCGKDVSA